MLSAPGHAVAHPHVYVDAGLTLIFDADGRLSAIRTRWTYDEFSTLMIVEDGAYDADGDGEISAGELGPLQDFDSHWAEGYDGDLHVSQGGEPIAAGPPTDWSAEWRNGQLTSVHTRRFDPPIDPAAGAIAISPYDPGFYVAYTVAPPPVMEGRADCRIEIARPDIDAAMRAMAADIANTPPDVALEDMGYLDVGAKFADRIALTCGH